MLTFDQASDIIQQIRPDLNTERIPLNQSLRRVLAEDLRADSDVPAFDRSAMDGYACRKSDVGNALKIIGEIPAGTEPKSRVGENECMRIMTGGLVPEGADFVVKQEDVEVHGKDWVRCTGPAGKDNIRKKGEDLRKGDLVLKAGCIISPRHIALLASGGLVEPMVYCKPTIAIISTGNELVPPDSIPGPAQIRESNGSQLFAQSAAMGLDPVYLGIAKDDKIHLTSLISKAVHSNTITMLSGGVSVGDYDYVPEILKDLGVTVLFHRIQVKPGKHLIFGMKDGHYVFGFPGNPVSSFVLFEVMVKQFLMQCMGFKGESANMLLPLAGDFQTNSTGLVQFLPVAIDGEGQVQTISYHGSAHVHAYADAFGIMEIPAGIHILKKGEKVKIRPI